MTPYPAFDDVTAKPLDLIAEYGNANYALGNKWHDDPDVNAEASERANKAWLAILDALGGVPYTQTGEGT